MASGVNFLTTVLLARQLGIDEFGKFMLAWLVLLFFKSLQGGLIIAPMMSIGPKQDDRDQAAYYGSVLLQQLGQVALGAALFLVGSWLLGAIRPEWHAPDLVVPVAAALVADQLQEFVRRYLFSRDRAAYAFAVDLMTYGSRTALLILVLGAAGSSGRDAFWIICGSSVLGVAISIPAFMDLRFARASLFETTRRHWHFAKWTTGSAILEWGSGHLIVIVAGGVLGPAVVGAIRATTNIFAAIQVLIQALNNTVPIRAAQLLVRSGEPALITYLRRVTLHGLLVCSVILALGAAFPERILQLLYGPGYAEYAYLVYWWVVIYIFGFLQFPLSAALRSIEFTKPFFISILFEAVFGLAMAYLLPRLFGIHGVMFGILVTRALPVLVLGWYAAVRWHRFRTAPLADAATARERV